MLNITRKAQHREMAVKLRLNYLMQNLFILLIAKTRQMQLPELFNSNGDKSTKQLYCS